MRDPHDQVTGELPAIEPPPPVPFEQLPQAARREAMRFQGPKARPACHQCRFCTMQTHEEDTPFERITLRCSVGGFPVQRGAVCEHFQSLQEAQQQTGSGWRISFGT
jgi:hypothetical protein